MIFPHTQLLFREQRLTFHANIATSLNAMNGLPASAPLKVALEASEKVMGAAGKGLVALKDTLLPSQLVNAAVPKVLQLGITGGMVAGLGLLYATGVYMIFAHKKPPWLQQFLGTPSS